MKKRRLKYEGRFDRGRGIYNLRDHTVTMIGNMDNYTNWRNGEIVFILRKRKKVRK